MGHGTCGISGLGIPCGTPVRIILLTQNPYHKGYDAGKSTVKPTDYWFPRCFPIKVEADEYGRIEKVFEGQKAQERLWLDGFKLDVVEKSWGDNMCHDIPVFKKNLTMNTLFDALSRGRVHVHQGDLIGRARRAKILYKLKDAKKYVDFRLPYASEVPEGYPRREQVVALLESFGYKPSMSLGDNGFVVNTVYPGTLRVRVEMYHGRENTLRDMQMKIGDKYATMVCAGTRKDPQHAELLIRPNPNEKLHWSCLLRKSKKDRSLAVSTIMIREDVWQALCNLTPRVGYKKEALTVKDYKSQARKLFKSSCEVFEYDTSGLLFGNSILFDEHKDNPIIDAANDEIPFTVGLGTSWWGMMVHYKRGKIKQPELNAFLDAVAEFMFVQDILFYMRRQWQPSSSSGPQFSEFELQAQALRAVTNVATKLSQQQKKKEEEDHREMEESGVQGAINRMKARGEKQRKKKA